MSSPAVDAVLATPAPAAAARTDVARAFAPAMNWSSQPPGVAAPDATAGLPRVMPVAISRGHRSSACATDMFAWLDKSGSLNPSRMCPSWLTCDSVALVTFAVPQIMGT